MSGRKKVRYEKKCDQCGDPFVASMKNARFCSGACRAKWNRDRKDLLFDRLLSQVPSSNEFERLIIKLAQVRGKNEDWINKQIILHKELLIDDAHHGYSNESAIEQAKEDIKVWIELNQRKAQK